MSKLIAITLFVKVIAHSEEEIFSCPPACQDMGVLLVVVEALPVVQSGDLRSTGHDVLGTLREMK